MPASEQALPLAASWVNDVAKMVGFGPPLGDQREAYSHASDQPISNRAAEDWRLRPIRLVPAREMA